MRTHAFRHAATPLRRMLLALHTACHTATDYTICGICIAIYDSNEAASGLLRKAATILKRRDHQIRQRQRRQDAIFLMRAAHRCHYHATTAY